MTVMVLKINLPLINQVSVCVCVQRAFENILCLKKKKKKKSTLFFYFIRSKRKTRKQIRVFENLVVGEGTKNHQEIVLKCVENKRL